MQNKNKKTLKIIFVCIFACAIVAAGILAVLQVVKEKKQKESREIYVKAVQLQSSEDYEEAKELFLGIFDYEDSYDRYCICDNYCNLELAKKAAVSNRIDEIEKYIKNIKEPFNDKSYVSLKNSLEQYHEVAEKLVGRWKSNDVSGNELNISAQVNESGCFIKGITKNPISVDSIKNGIICKERYSADDSIICTYSVNSSYTNITLEFSRKYVIQTYFKSGN